MMRRGLVRLGVAGILTLVVAVAQIGVGGSVFRPVTAEAAGCWNYGCDYRNPVSYYCVYDQQTIDSVTHYDWLGRRIATQNLKWSNECAANWSEIYSDYYREMWMETSRDNGETTVFDAYTTFGRTLMLGGLSNFVKGCSQVRDNWWHWTPFKCTGWH